MKQLKLNFMLTALLLLAVINVNAEVLSGQCGANLTYQFYPETGLLKIGGSGSMNYYNNDYNVPWRSYKQLITQVEFPNGMTTIGRYAFSSCSNLTSVTIPNSVTTIELCAFVDCSSLVSVTMGNSLKSIGENAFYNCPNLISVTIPNSVTTISKAAFMYCSGLISVTIGNSVTSIGDYAFNGCSGITSLTIPNSVISIGNYAFSGLGITSVTIPNSVTNIGNSAFSCESLMSVTIGNSLTDIGTFAFGHNLTETIIANNIFIFLPRAYTGDYTIPSGITKIAGGALAYCSGLTSVTIPNSVTSIGDNAFRNCSGLTSVSIPGSVTRIGSYAFSELNNITSITIPNSVTYIGSGAFYKCSKTTSLTIPNSITSIESSVFSGCSGLTSLSIPNSVTSIGNYAFSECSGLTSITIPNSVKSIGKSAFENCSALTSITIPNSVTNIGGNVFSGCSNIYSINWDSNINSSPFSGGAKYSVREVTIGDNVNIVYTTFSGLSKLNKVVLGKNVAYLRADAFKDCGIQEFYVTGEEAPYCYPGVFADVALNNATLYAPSDKTSYYQETAPWNGFGKILTLEGNEPPSAKQCAAPVIMFSNGKVTCTSETGGARCVINCSVSYNNSGEDEVEVAPQLTVTAVAKAEGYKDSEPVTETFVLGTGSDLPGDINNDGKLSVSDIVNIAEKILNGETE